jgi:hypothetical protein
MKDEDRISRVTDAQLKALDELMAQTHRLLGVIDEMEGHPMLTDEQQDKLTSMYQKANELDNTQAARLSRAKDTRGIDQDEHVEDHIDLGEY